MLTGWIKLIYVYYEMRKKASLAVDIFPKYKMGQKVSDVMSDTPMLVTGILLKMDGSMTYECYLGNGETKWCRDYELKHAEEPHEMGYSISLR